MWRCKRCETDNSESDLQCNGCDWHAPQLVSFNYALLDEYDSPTFNLNWKFAHTNSLKCNKVEGALSIDGSESISFTKKSKITFFAENEFAICEFSKMISIPSPQVSFFESDRDDISLGIPLNLSWKCKYAESVILSGFGDVTDRISQQIDLKESSVITLTAINSAGSDSKTISLNLPEPIIKYFEAGCNYVISGDKITLNWKTINSAVTWIKTASKKVIVTENSSEITLDEDGDLELIAENESGRASAKLKIDVLAKPKLNNFRTSNKTVLIGKPFYINWELENYTSAIIHYGDTSLNVSDIQKLELIAVESEKIELEIYSLNNLKVIKKEIYVKVIHPVEIITFNASKNYTIQTKPVILYWDVKNAEEIIITPINKTVSAKGELSVKPSTKTIYKISASNELTSESIELEIDVFSIPSFTHFKFANPPKFQLPQYGGAKKTEEIVEKKSIFNIFKSIKLKFHRNKKNIFSNKVRFINIVYKQNDLIEINKLNLRDTLDLLKSMTKKHK